MQGLSKLPCGAKVICHLPAVGTCEISKSASMRRYIKQIKYLNSIFFVHVLIELSDLTHEILFLELFFS